jgi:hypothetical protein
MAKIGFFRFEKPFVARFSKNEEFFFLRVPCGNGEDTASRGCSWYRNSPNWPLQRDGDATWSTNAIRISVDMWILRTLLIRIDRMGDLVCPTALEGEIEL